MKGMKLKKYLFAFLAVAGLAALAACSDDEGMEPGNDSSPVVTVYTYSAPDGYDSDITTFLRVVPNNQVKHIYVLTEPRDDKNSYVASNGEQAYIDRVVSEGKEYEGKSQDLIISDLVGYYTTTIVAVGANGARCSKESVFKGIEWVDGGQALVSENIAGLSGTVKVQRQSDTNIFRVVGLYSQLNPDLGSSSERFIFTFEGSGDSAVCTEFTTTNAPFFLVFLKDGGALYHGYYDASNFTDYCYVKMLPDDEQGPCVGVSCLMLDNNAGMLSPGGQIKFYTSDLVWFE